MNEIQAILLGIMQGFTEFLPVSSSGHLALLQKLFGIENTSLLFEVVLHVGTLIPIVIWFRKDLWKLIRNPFQKTTFLLAIATVPPVIVALLFGDMIDRIFEATQFLAFGFIITGCLLLYTDSIKSGYKKVKDITYMDALIIGIMEAVAIAPAISRSGSTISASLFRGLSRETAAKFSFLMSIPAIVGALLLQIIKTIQGDIILSEINWLNMGLGFIWAALSGFLAIPFMFTLIKKCKLKYFSFYLFVLALFILIDQYILGSALLK